KTTSGFSIPPHPPQSTVATAYLAGRLDHRLPPGSALLVVDLGAGTADVALVRTGTAPEVVAHGGVDVGGLDIDSALVELLGKVVAAEAPDRWRRLATPADDAGRRDRFAFWQEVRAAKESLSRLTVAPVHVPGHPAGLHLTRDELESVAAPLLAPVVDLAASLAAGEAPLAGVLLVGGGSRLPLLGRMLHQRLGVVPTSVERPETAVVEGALLAVPAPAVPLPPKAPGRTRRRWVSPVTLVLALVCFLLPFATVSCGLPGGYGRADTGGVTEYSGLDLAVGGAPAVAAEHIRPRGEWRDDRLEPQPAQALALLATLAALTAGLALARDRRRRGAALTRDRRPGVALAADGPRPGVALVPDGPRPGVALARERRRHGVVASLAGVGAVLLVAGQAVVTSRLAGAVRGQSAIPEGKAAADYVGTGAGFWLATGLLALVAGANLVRWRRPRG
ncbi:Hsp70 family protein, partial [Dactylosporangium sp. NPDC005572]|uniref:Hsp70 family protein n=1 Tax=Dactylosporangium sp. NPDC005572 TaxID=3156889 RepID=UPI0033B25248